MRIETDSDASDRPMPGVPVARPYGRFVPLDASAPENVFAIISETKGRVARGADVAFLLPVYRIAARNALRQHDRHEDDRPRLDFAIFKWHDGDQWELVAREVELEPAA